MSIRSRQQQLLEHVNAVGVASVGDMAGLYGVSEMTIRRDIDHLGRSGLLRKVKGGAQRLEESARFHEAQLRARMTMNVPAKRRIAERAADFIAPGDTVFLDGSTTIICLAQVLARTNPQITAVTNSVLVELELAEAGNVRLIGLGGIFDHDTFSFCPMDGADAPGGYHVRKAFLSCTGLDVEEGTFENSVFNMAIKRKVVRSAETIYLLADADKLGRRALNRVLDIDEIDVLITEDTLAPDAAASLAAAGVAVHRVARSESARS